MGVRKSLEADATTAPGLTDSTLPDSISYWAGIEPDRTCLTVIRGGGVPSAELRYSELQHEALAFGGYLREAHPRGSRILLAYEFGPEFLISFLGCLDGGMIPVPGPAGPGQAGRRDAQPACVLTVSALAPDLADLVASAAGSRRAVSGTISGVMPGLAGGG